MKQPKLKSCFLIDDDVVEQELFLTAMQETNAEVICRCHHDPEQALTLLQASSERPDIIFLDIRMPKMDGFEFITRLKNDETLRSIPVIFYAGTTDDDQIEKATVLGASGFIKKTNRYAELCQSLKTFVI